MKKGFTLIELLVVLFIVAILIAIAVGSCGGSMSSGFGRNMQLISTENGVMTKKHFKDLNSGQCFYTIGGDSSGNGIVYSEPCR